MPAAAVIPALIAYIKVVAVKKLVVGFWGHHRQSAFAVCTACGFFSFPLRSRAINLVCDCARDRLL